MNLRWTLALTTAAMLALSGCATAATTGEVASGGDPVDVRGEWLYVGGSTADGPLAVPSFPVTMEFVGQNARVRTGCFSFEQPLGAELSVTTIAHINSPMASCLGLTDAENSAIQSLSTVTGADRTGDSLVMFSPSVELEFELVPAVALDEMAGTWALAGAVLFGDTAVMTELAATLTIGSDGSVTGTTGCDDFSGTIDIASGTNEVRDLAFVETDCSIDDAVVATMVREVFEGGFLVHMIDGGSSDNGGSGGSQLSLVATGADTTINYAPVA